MVETINEPLIDQLFLPYSIPLVLQHLIKLCVYAVVDGSVYAVYVYVYVMYSICMHDVETFN